MGIRFKCPNGHKLNVKSFLAGKRGFCPHCGMKVSIPLGSDAKHSMAGAGAPILAVPSDAVPIDAVPIDAVPIDAVPISATQIPSDSSNDVTSRGPLVTPDIPAPIQPSSPIDPIRSDPAANWYVRPVTGGEFGPAQGNLLTSWIEEGRVAGDSMIWQEGWADWRIAQEVFPQLNTQAAGVPAIPIPQQQAVVGHPTSSQVPQSTMQDRRRSKKRMKVVMVVVLSVMAVVLTGVLIWVLNR